MAIGVVLEVKGASAEQYDKVLELMGYTPGGAGAPGGIFHWVSVTDDGLRITDVWETREIFEKFAAEKIGPYMREAGVESQPEVTFYEVHNTLHGASVTA